MNNLKRITLLVLMLTISATSLSAQSRKERRKAAKLAAETALTAAPDTVVVVKYEKVFVETAPKPASPLECAVNLTPTERDSLVAVWSNQQSMESYQSFFDTYIKIDSTATTTVPDSVYINRLRKLASPIPLAFNNIVKPYIARYTNTRYGTIRRMLELSQYYFPIFETELLREGIPIELRILPIIESAMSPTVVSPAGARGLWQFMPVTGRSYGLEINSLIDERCDPLLSTRAACRYLKDLYGMYGDWLLALAAYNCGPGNINKAFARAGKDAKTFWDIYDYLPSETRLYVPAFIGATYAYAYHEQHNIEPKEAPMPLATDTIQVRRLMHFKQVSSTINVPFETLKLLNPQYNLDIIPATTKPYTLVLPQEEVSNYITMQDSIFKKDSTYLKEYLDPSNLSKKRQQSTSLIHRVRSGETLGAIARKYRVSVKSIMRWNHLRNADRLSIGQRLRIEGR